MNIIFVDDKCCCSLKKITASQDTFDFRHTGNRSWLINAVSSFVIPPPPPPMLYDLFPFISKQTDPDCFYEQGVINSFSVSELELLLGVFSPARCLI